MLYHSSNNHQYSYTRTGITLATAHPAKLKTIMERIIDESLILLAQLARFVSCDLHITKMPNGFTAFKRLLLDNA